MLPTNLKDSVNDPIFAAWNYGYEESLKIWSEYNNIKQECPQSLQDMCLEATRKAMRSRGQDYFHALPLPVDIIRLLTRELFAEEICAACEAQHDLMPLILKVCLAMS